MWCMHEKYEYYPNEWTKLCIYIYVFAHIVFIYRSRLLIQGDPIGDGESNMWGEQQVLKLS